MKPQALINALLRSGLWVTVDGNKILASPRNLLTDDARQLISENQAALHSFLAIRKSALYQAAEVVAEISAAVH